MPRSRRSQGRAWNRTVHRGYQQTPRRLGAWLAWDADNRLTHKTLANGITVTYTYDAASRLTRLVYRNSTAQVLEDITYTYDAAGQRTARSSTNPLGANDTPLQASYDANNRLTSLTLNPGTPQAKTYTLSYNPAGSLTSKVNTADANDRTTYTWDSSQRLTQVSTPEHTAVYQYDLLGRRVQRQITKPGFPPETTHYVYDGLQAVGEIRPQQSSTSLMTGLNLDEMLARVTTLNATNTTQARTYLTDALGSVMAQTQDNQSTLAGYSYSPYGQTQSTGNTEGDSVQYTGRENDNNGLYYYRARYYDPVLKRFLSEDPIGLAGGSLSFYSYVNGNPVSLTDPLGLQAYMCQNAGLGAWCPKPQMELCCSDSQKECLELIKEETALCAKCIWNATDGSKETNPLKIDSCLDCLSAGIKVKKCRERACKLVPKGECKKDDCSSPRK